MFRLAEEDPFADPSAGPSATATRAAPAAIPPRAARPAVHIDLRRSKFNRVDLVRRAWRMLESFLTEYPDDPAADQAAFAAATALLDLRAYDDAAAACNRYAVRYPKSDLLDSFWYVAGYCRFATGRHEAALEMCRKVAEATRIDPDTGRREPSRNKWQAVYILGQVYHSLGRAADAIREYRRVEDQFVDARQSIAYFLRKAIELPEVVTLKPGEPAEVELTFRNVAACDLKVYRIDLMKFSLLKRSLGGITRINLAGIRPHHQATIALGDGRDYRDRTRKLTLPLKEEGAYLVVCRGDNLYASGLVLVTPLAVEVQADAASGRVRTTVKDRVNDKYVSDVHVKVIGSGNADFVSGQTDLRGLFVADGIRGGATVIALAGPSRYAFYRAKEATVPLPEVVAADGRLGPGQAGRASVSLASDAEARAKIEAELREPTQLEFVETPLTDVIDYLKERHKIEIQLDRRALSDVGIGTDTPVTRNLQGVSLKSALRLMLRELELTYIIKDGVVLITTPERAESELETRIYPVGDLVLPSGSTDGSQADFDSLIDLITSTIKPTSWDEVGGPGSIKPFATNMTVTLSQTQEVHEEIEALLERLRQVSRETGGRGLPMLSTPGHSRGGRPDNGRGQPGMFGGGMGGMGGGMMGGSMGGANPPGLAPNAKTAPTQPQPADLLEGVQQTNKSNQGKQSEKLNKKYKDSGGKGGVGAGMF
jgi:tetratricopeptide (TPR) repeat protein